MLLQLKLRYITAAVRVLICAYFLSDDEHRETLGGPDPDCEPSPSAPADSALCSAGRKTSVSPGTLLQCQLTAISITEEDKYWIYEADIDI